MLRIVKIVLILSVGLWGLLGAIGNLVDWSGTMGSVAAVTAMSTFEGGADRWQATSNPAVVWAGALFIPLFKLAATTACFLGAIRMWNARQSGAAAFAAAKSLALVGCGIAMFGLFLGWIVIGEQWFELWRSPALGAAGDIAFRYAGFVAFIALFVAIPDE